MSRAVDWYINESILRGVKRGGWSRGGRGIWGGGLQKFTGPLLGHFPALGGGPKQKLKIKADFRHVAKKFMERKILWGAACDCKFFC